MIEAIITWSISGFIILVGAGTLGFSIYGGIMVKQLTEKQQKFLEVLFEEAKGDPVTAKKLAGYADGVASTQIVNSLTDEIAELTKNL